MTKNKSSNPSSPASTPPAGEPNLNGGHVDDPFAPENLRLSQDFAESVGVRKLLTTVHVRRPNNQTFFRVHPDPSMRLETAVLDLKEDNETYIVAGPVRAELSAELVPKVLFTTLDRQGVLRLWPIRLPGPDGNNDSWSESALMAAERAMHAWVRLRSNRALGAYEIFEAEAVLDEPEWPDLSFQEFLKVAFRGRMIESLDHPVLRRLRGEL